MKMKKLAEEIKETLCMYINNAELNGTMGDLAEALEFLSNDLRPDPGYEDKEYLTGDEIVDRAISGYFEDGQTERYLIFHKNDLSKAKEVVEVFDDGDWLMAVEIFHGERIGNECYVSSYKNYVFKRTDDDDSSEKLMYQQWLTEFDTLLESEKTKGRTWLKPDEKIIQDWYRMDYEPSELLDEKVLKAA